MSGVKFRFNPRGPIKVGIDGKAIPIDGLPAEVLRNARATIMYPHRIIVLIDEERVPMATQDVVDDLAAKLGRSVWIGVEGEDR